MARLVGTLGTIETITVGGRVFTSLTTLKILSCLITSGSFSSARNPESPSGTGYTPSGATAFKIKALDITSKATAQNVGFGYSTGDAGIAGGSPTGMIFFGSGSSSSYQDLFANTSQHWQYSYQATVPNGKYLTNRADFDGAALIYGYEE